MVFRLLVWTVMLGQVVLAQGLVSFSSTSENVRYPYSLRLRNESEVSRTVQLGDVQVYLYPVAPGLGKEAEAQLIFAPNTPTSVKLPRHSRNVTLPFRLETDAPRGVYALETNLPGIYDNPNPPGYTPVSDYPLAYIPDLHVPRMYRTGQRFLYLGSNSPENSSKDYRRASRPLQHRQVYGRVFTLTAYERGRVTFEVEGLGKAMLRSASRTNFPGLAPILGDPGLATVKRAYVGKRVWQYGGPDVSCKPAPGTSLDFRGSPQQRLRVRRVLRVARPSGLKLAGGAGFGGYAASYQGDMMTGTPLVVQFEKPKGLYMESASGGDDLSRLTDKPNAELLRRCPPFTMLFADTWQLERTYSFTPPPPGLKPRSRSVGLSRSQYAWREGFPSSIFGTKARLLTLNTWKYDSIPFPITVTFKNGRAVKRDVPRLP